MMEKDNVWFKTLPSKWESQKLKFSVNLRSEKVTEDIGEIYVGLENIESKTGKYIQSEKQVEQTIEGTSNKFYKGDVLFGKLRPYLAKCIESDFDGICTTELLVLDTVNKKILSTYLKYMLLSPKFIDYVNSSTYGSKMPRANWEFIKNIEIPLPSVSIQRHIEDFIEKKVAEIDSLVSGKEKMIKLLEEKRQAMITEAVTKGLNPNVKMKDSGVEWIGEIPEHWSEGKINYYSNIRTGGTPDKNKEEYWKDGNINWMASGEVNKYFIYEVNNKITISGLNNSNANMLPVNTVMIALNGQGKTKGKVAVLKIETTCNQSLAGFIGTVNIFV